MTEHSKIVRGISIKRDSRGAWLVITADVGKELLVEEVSLPSSGGDELLESLKLVVKQVQRLMDREAA